eukprot:4755189-Prymnesium_polylepis.1
MHTPHSPTAPDGDATRSRPGAGDTHSTRQLVLGGGLTAPPPPQQVWLPSSTLKRCEKSPSRSA